MKPDLNTVINNHNRLVQQFEEVKKMVFELIKDMAVLKEENVRLKQFIKARSFEPIELTPIELPTFEIKPLKEFNLSKPAPKTEESVEQLDNTFNPKSTPKPVNPCITCKDRNNIRKCNSTSRLFCGPRLQYLKAHGF